MHSNTTPTTPDARAQMTRSEVAEFDKLNHDRAILRALIRDLEATHERISELAPGCSPSVEQIIRGVMRLVGKGKTERYPTFPGVLGRLEKSLEEARRALETTDRKLGELNHRVTHVPSLIPAAWGRPTETHEYEAEARAHRANLGVKTG